MFDFLQVAIAEWGLYAAALACFALAFAAFAYIPVFGQYIAYALVALGVALVAYDLGYSERGSLDNSSVIQARLDEANRELAATKQVADDSVARAAAREAEAIQNRGKIDVYEKTLKAAPETGGCGLSDDDVRGLSDVGTGGPPLPPRRPAGLRPAGQNARAR